LRELSASPSSARLDRAPDDRELLVVLLAEDRDVGPDQVQELHDDRRDALEMPGPERPAEDARQARYVHDRAAGRAERIHLRDGRQEQHVGAELAEQRGVGLRRPRIGGEVLARAELQRVHEHARNHAARVQVGRADEARVPGVQVAHGRDERDALAREPPLVHEGAHVRDPRDGLHLDRPG
jgi:hypothetical protein